MLLQDLDLELALLSTGDMTKLKDLLYYQHKTINKPIYRHDYSDVGLTNLEKMHHYFQTYMNRIQKPFVLMSKHFTHI